MWFNKNKKSPDTITSEVDYSGDRTQLCMDTLASVLRSIGEFALPTSTFQLKEFRERCESLARESLLGPLSDGANDSRDANKTHAEIRQVVRQQRAVESREYATHRDSARIIVSGLVANLRKSLESGEQRDQEIVGLLTEMEKVVSLGDLESIQRIANRTASRIREVISSDRELERQRFEGLSQQLANMREELTEVQGQARQDSLTGLLNRGAFDAELRQAVTVRRGTDLSLFIMDLDHFKRVNDDYGHPAGDEVLKQVSRKLLLSFPRKDDVVARYGGEEFVALCRNVGPDHVEMLAERARAGVEKLQVETDEGVIYATISIGFAVLEEEETDVAFLKRADEALYRAKKLGRDRCEGDVLDKKKNTSET